MHSQELLAQAQQGNPKIIAAILNHALKPRGIKAQVARRETRLYVLLQAIAVPPEAGAIALVTAMLRQLNAKPIETVAIHGQRMGDKSVAWRQEILLHAEVSAPPTFAFDVTQSANTPPTNPATPVADPVPTQLDHAQPLRDEIESEVAPPAAETAPVPTFEIPVPDPLPADPLPSEILSPEIQSPEIKSPEIQSPEIKSLEVPDAVDTLQPNPWDEPPTVTEQASPTVSAAAISRGAMEAIAPAVLDKDLQSPKLEEVLRRPEAVVLLLFVSVLILWQAYLDLTESAWEESDIALSSEALAQRLGVSRATIYRRKNKAGFSTWTQTLDPDGIAWVYVAPKFIPALM